MSYFFNPSARVEYLEHVAYYESQQPGLGARYLGAFDAAMVKVCEAPHRYRVEFPPNIRRYRIPGFPYNILYRQVGADIEVLVIAPHRRRPNYWLDRLFMRTELVATLQRHATELLSELVRDKEPILITQHGVPSAYLVDVETYETLQRRLSLLEGIARGERAIEEGRTLSHAQAKQRMTRWLR